MVSLSLAHLLSSGLDSSTVSSLDLSIGFEYGGSTGSETSEDLEEELLSMQVDEAVDRMPELLPASYMDWDDNSEDSRDEVDSEGMEDGGQFGSGLRLAQYVRQTAERMYTNQYEQPRNISISHPPPQMPHILSVTKLEHPDQFRKILHVSPTTFDKIVDKIKYDPVFYNNSNNPKIPIKEQLAITLYHFDHDGNASSQAEVGRWASAGKRVFIPAYEAHHEHNIVPPIYE